MADSTLVQRVLAAGNPRRLSPPSNVSDPDGLLSAVAEVTVNDILRRCPHEVGLALFRSLHQPRHETLTSNLLHEIARAIFDRWGIGRRGINDGALYVMSYNDRKHHLLVGRGLTGRLDHTTRGAILNKAVDGLRRGDVDAAIIELVKRLVWELRWGWVIRRIFRLAAVTIFTTGILWWIFEKRVIEGYMLYKTSRQRERLRKDRQDKLRLAWERMAGFDNETSTFCKPCVVCVQPLSTTGQDWMCELALCRRGCLVPVDDNASHGLPILVRLPEPLQRRVVGFLGPSLQCFLDGDCRKGAIADGVELFKCSHVLHKDCADEWLKRKKTCPVCRMPDPRITALAAVPTAFACAQVLHQATASNAVTANDVVVNVLDAAVDVAIAMEQPTYTSHAARVQESAIHTTSARTSASQSGGRSVLSSLLESPSDGAGWGGGFSFGGAGTSGDW